MRNFLHQLIDDGADLLEYFGYVMVVGMDKLVTFIANPDLLLVIGIMTIIGFILII